MLPARTSAIWLFGATGVALVSVVLADGVVPLGLPRSGIGPLAFAGQLCILVCLWLMKRRRARG